MVRLFFSEKEVKLVFGEGNITESLIIAEAEDAEKKNYHRMNSKTL